MFNKKAQTGGLITGLIFGIASLVIGVIIALVITSTLSNAGLLSAGDEASAVGNLTANFTAGIDNVSAKIPTVLLVAAIVLILGVLALLVATWQRMRLSGGGI